MSRSSTAFLTGARHISPLLLGVLPFALVYGASAMNAGMDVSQALAMSLMVFAGASQLAAVDLVGQGAPALVIVATVLVINLRMSMYSAAISPHFQDLSGRWRAGLAYLLTDQAFAVSVTGFETRKVQKRWYYLGAALALWATWQAGSLMGVVVGASIPESWSLDFAVPLTFIALLVPALKDSALESAAAAAGLVALLAAGLPWGLGLLVAAMVGVAAGVLVDMKEATR